MPLLTPLKAMFEAQRASRMPDGIPPAQMRDAIHRMIEQSFLALTHPQAAAESEHDIVIEVKDGSITLRVYRNGEYDAALPCHIYYHGGGFFCGNLNLSDGECRQLARAVGCAVISVDYRLAPEHRFPVAADDSYAALCWVEAHANELHIDPARISVGGGSAGGNLAAVVAQMARDRGGPHIIAQVLEIPVTDFTSTRTLDFPDEGIHIAAEKAYSRLYLRGEADAYAPQASPLLASSLADLPPAMVLCAEYDQLQPEGESYALRLQDAGVPTVYRLLHGEFHGSSGFDAVIPDEAKATRSQIASFLRRAYERELTDS